MTRIDRRRFSALAGASLAVSALGLPKPAVAQGKAKIVIVGGGIGGATVANYVRKGAPTADVTLVEPLELITTCFGSNLVLGGVRTVESLTHDYRGLKRLGVKMVRDRATAIDTAKKTVTLAGGDVLPYDKLVLSPGIDFKTNGIEGYTEEAMELMPHAWQGGRQLTLLKRQVEDMEDGGVVIIASPTGTYRCPPAPYERACMIAYYLKTHKPKSKLILLEGKRTFAKEALFKQAFKAHYDGIIELRQTTEIDEYQVVRVDAKAREVVTRGGEKLKAAVVNIIPPQKAGAIAHQAGVVDGDWCPIDPETFMARKAKDVYVLGDAILADPIPKSGFAANNQAKLVANDIVAAVAGGQKFPPRLRNTCWSLLSRANTVKIGASYSVKNGQIVASNAFVSALDDPALTRARNTSEYFAWYDNITSDIFAKG